MIGYEVLCIYTQILVTRNERTEEVLKKQIKASGPQFETSKGGISVWC